MCDDIAPLDPTLDSVGFPGASAVESICSAGDVGSILGVGRSAGQGNGNPLQ